MGVRVLKKASMALMALVLSFGLMVPAAFADDLTVTNIAEKEGSGSIVVTVLDNTPDGAGTGAKVDVSEENPLKDVSINALRIGSVVELTTTGSGTVTTQVAYGLSSDVASKLGLVVNGQGANYIAEKNGTYYFEPTVVQNALSKADQDSIEEYASGSTMNAVTDGEGVAQFSGLSYGLYLLAKNNLPASATTDFVPFLVSVPMYVESDSGSTWQSTVYAYPKVRSDKINVTKTVDDQDKSVNSGQTLNYTIVVDVPVPEESGDASMQEFTTFNIVDTNTDGTLNVDKGSVKVYLSADDQITDNEALESDDYVVQGPALGADEENKNNKITTVTLSEKALSELNDKLLESRGTNKEDYYVIVTYAATLNTDKFSHEISNSALVEFQRESMSASHTTDPSTVDLYTYGIDLTKTLSDNGTIDGSEISFGLYKDSDSGTPVYAASGTGGYWQAESNTDGAETSMNVTDKDGKLYLYGLEPGTYYLKEISTMDGYALLDEPIKIVINSKDSSGTDSATVNDVSANVNDGVVSLSVENTKISGGFTLPKTGGLGTLIMTAIGLGLLCVAIVLLTTYRKKNKKNA